MQAVSRVAPNGMGGGANFINGSTLNIVTRSRYGRKAVGNLTREIRAARNLVAATSETCTFKNRLWIVYDNLL